MTEVRDVLTTVAGALRAAHAALDPGRSARIAIPVSAAFGGAAAILDGIGALLESRGAAEVEALILALSRQPARRADFGQLDTDVAAILAEREDAPTADDEDAVPVTDNNAPTTESD